MCHASYAPYERVVEDNMRPSVQKFKLNWNWIDQHDNDTKHSIFAKEWLKKRGLWKWPIQSPAESSGVIKNIFHTVSTLKQGKTFTHEHKKTRILHHFYSSSLSFHILPPKKSKQNSTGSDQSHQRCLQLWKKHNTEFVACVYITAVFSALSTTLFIYHAGIRSFPSNCKLQ